MTWLHGLTGAVTIGIGFAVVGMAWPSIALVVEWIRSSWVGLMPQADVAAGVLGALRQSFVLALVAGACLVVGPLALYFALSDD
jgi:hypothetical protein